MLEWDDRKDTFEKPRLYMKDFLTEGFKYMSEFPEFIFKGASLLAFINKNIDTVIFRETKDIDITNIGLKKEDIKLIMEDFISFLKEKYDLSELIIAENSKTINSEIYYTVDFINKDTKRIEFNIDFSVAAEYGQGYLYHTEIKDIIGYNINKIFSDKMSTISTKQIFSRIKDFVDLYNMSLNSDYIISYSEICKFNNLNEDFKVGDFRQLLTMKDNIKKAFKKMRNIELENGIDKEEIFDKMYIRVIDFVAPFISDNTSLMRHNTIWNKDIGAWVHSRR